MKTMVALICDECELCLADLLNIGQLDDGMKGRTVFWLNRVCLTTDRLAPQAPRFLESELRKMGLSIAVKQDLRRGFGISS